MKMKALLVSMVACMGCGAEGLEGETSAEVEGEAQSALASNKDFDVDFSDCAEFAGLGFVPAARARPLVPASYALAGDAQNAIAVVRVASCANAVVDGKSVGRTITSQLGIMVAGGDASADINNYTVGYATNQAKLHARFQAAGLKTDKSNDLLLQLVGTKLTAHSSSSKTSEFDVRGTAAVPSSAPTTFTASWWGNGVHGVVRSRTTFPTIRFGTASTVLTTPASSDLGHLLNGTTLTFAALDSYNTFSTAHLEVRDTD
jgi:hypothetical protein